MEVDSIPECMQKCTRYLLLFLSSKTRNAIVVPFYFKARYLKQKILKILLLKNIMFTVVLFLITLFYSLNPPNSPINSVRANPNVMKPRAGNPAMF